MISFGRRVLTGVAGVKLAVYQVLQGLKGCLVDPYNLLRVFTGRKTPTTQCQ